MNTRKKEKYTEMRRRVKVKDSRVNVCIIACIYRQEYMYSRAKEKEREMR
jgi:hypothetical protein